MPPGISDDTPLGIGNWRTLSKVPQKQCSVSATDATFWCVGEEDQIFHYELGLYFINYVFTYRFPRQFNFNLVAIFLKNEIYTCV